MVYDSIVGYMEVREKMRSILQAFVEPIATLPYGNLVGRVPLILLFLAGNSTPTIPHMFSKRKDSGFPYGCADSAAADGRRGSNVYEVNPWLWQFGRGKPRLGGLTVKETAERNKAAREEKFKRAWETRRHRKSDKA